MVKCMVSMIRWMAKDHNEHDEVGLRLGKKESWLQLFWWKLIVKSQKLFVRILDKSKNIAENEGCWQE